MKKILYSNVVGSLIYAIVYTKPNIAHAMNVVSMYMANPDKGHQLTIKWILKYIKGSANVSLLFKNNFVDVPIM